MMTVSHPYGITNIYTEKHTCSRSRHAISIIMSRSPHALAFLSLTFPEVPISNLKPTCIPTRNFSTVNKTVHLQHWHYSHPAHLSASVLAHLSAPQQHCASRARNQDLGGGWGFLVERQRRRNRPRVGRVRVGAEGAVAVAVAGGVLLAVNQVAMRCHRCL